MGYCSICGREGQTRRGWCDTHYRRWRSHGDPGPIGLMHASPGSSREQRFWRMVDRGPDDACWPWKGHVDKWGYAMLHSGSDQILAHRFAYELLVSPIPKGLQIDHLCRWPSCVNPRHMEPVTQAEHNRRTHSKTHCKWGHPLCGDNEEPLRAGGRQCRTCARARSRESARRRAAAQQQPKAPKPAKTQCPQGHPYAGDNLYINPALNAKTCRTCTREAQRRYQQRKKAKRAT